VFSAFALAGLMPVFAETITVAFEEWPPYEFSSNNDVVGTDALILKEVGKRLGVTFNFVSLPWARALSAVTRGDVDAIFSLSKSPEREKDMVFPATPLNYERKVFLSLKGSGVKVAGWADLKGLKVGVVRGNNNGKDFDAQSGYVKVEADNQEQLISMLAGKRFDVAITSDMVGLDIAKKLGYATLVEMQPFVVAEMPLFLAFSKAKGTKAEKWAALCSEQLTLLKKEGVIDRILQTYTR
jgi:polar amino acid transport system substrate-binding protein